jgi:hypothetical protein
VATALDESKLLARESAHVCNPGQLLWCQPMSAPQAVLGANKTA